MLKFCSVVFVHGLTGDRKTTWAVSKDVPPWPQTLLPRELPTARTLTFGYDAYISDWKGVVSQNRIADHAMNLLNAVATHREQDDTVSSRHTMTGD
jgi:protein SERAC1